LLSETSFTVTAGTRNPGDTRERPEAGDGAAQPRLVLLHFENNIIYRLFPMHVGMRWYWRDFESMERWTRSEPHRKWWKDYLKGSKGTGFWHETYFMQGGIEAIYDDLPKPVGLQAFAENIPCRGAMFSSRQRAGRPGETPVQPEGVAGADLY
jgi:hypothetical protein